MKMGTLKVVIVKTGLTEGQADAIIANFATERRRLEDAGCRVLASFVEVYGVVK